MSPDYTLSLLYTPVEEVVDDEPGRSWMSETLSTHNKRRSIRPRTAKTNVRIL